MNFKHHLQTCRTILACATLFLTIILPKNLNAQTYCASKGNLPWQEWIDNVRFGTINNTSSKEGYGDFTSQTASFAQGSSNTLTVTQGFSWAADPSNQTQQGRAWIDFNKNGTFEDTEIVASFTRSVATANVVIPATATNGTTRMRISMKTSGVPTACETFEKGEVEDYTINITGGANVPDLTLANLNVVDEVVQQGQNLNWKVDVKNIGLGNATGNFTVKAYISTDNQLDANDVQAGAITVTSLAAGATNLQMAGTSLIPANLPLGFYFLILSVDADQNFIEFNENNNILPSVSIFTVKSSRLLPDLIINNFTRLDLTAQQGGKLLFNYAASNIGTVTVTGRFKVGFYLSTDQTLDANDVLSGSVMSIRDIMVSPPFFYIFEDSLTVPPTLAPGNYYLILKIDADNQIVEVDETNNTVVSQSTINITGSTTDPCAGVQVITRNVVWKDFYVELEVGLTGGAADQLYVFQYPSIRQISDMGSTYTANGEVRMNQFTTLKVAATGFSPPLYVGTAGSVSFSGFVATPNQPTCNLPTVTLVRPTGGGNLPDLFLTNLVVPNPSVQIGQILNFSADFRNVGLGNATGNFTVKSYLSIDPFISLNDYQNGTIPTANFAAGQSVLQVAGAMNVNATVPAGVYYLILKIDADNQIAESNEGNNTIVASTAIVVTTGGATCFNKFQMIDGFALAGQCSANQIASNEYGTFQMLGTRISDGFAYYTSSPNQYGLSANYFTKQPPTTTPPAGVTFRTCTGVTNWLYFVVQGYSQDERFTSVINTQYFRVGFFGTETNPDSILIESAQFNGVSRLAKSTAKSLNCSTCVTNDNTPPVFSNCPTSTITYSQPFSPNALKIENIINRGFGTPGTNVQVTDNCNAPMIGFQYINEVYWGGVYPISLIAFDSAGNKATCNFNLKIPCSPSVSGPTISNCPTNINLQAATGQTCAAATWTAPNVSIGGSPSRLSSNFASGACFPIGSTTVIYTASDSCGFTATCSFTVTVTGVTTTNYCASKGIAPWEYWVANVNFGTINNTSVQFKDINTLGYSDYTSLSTALNKGQSYPLSITPGLSWIGNLPNTYCRVWIDFNNNKVFDANELVLEKTNANPLTQSVLIPATAVTGAVRMRVALKFGAYPTPCENFDRGEVEDYTVNITGGTGGTPQLAITNVTGPTSATPGSSITLVVTVKNTGTAPTVPTKLYYAQTPTSSRPLILTDNTLTIAPLAVNETRVINYTLTLKNPIYPPNARYITGYSSPFDFGDYAVIATNVESSAGAPDFFGTDPRFVFNIAPIFPQANISVNVVPNKTNLNRNEPWNAVYTIKNNSTTLIKQVFFNLGTFQRTSRNFLAKNYDVLGVGTLPVNSDLKRTIGEVDILGLDMFDLAAGESRNVTLNFSRILTYADQGGSTDTTITGTLPFPFVNSASNVVNTNTTVGSPISINVGTPIVVGNQPDLTLANLTVPTPSVQQGQILNFKVDIKNIGTAAATGSFTVKSYLSTDQILSANDYADGIVPTGGFTAGQSILQVPAAMTVNSTVAAGQYYLILKVDADNQITESNENNNTIVSAGLVTVTAPTTGGADIALSITSTPSVYTRFAPLAFTITAKNLGSQAFTNVSVKFSFPANTSNGGAATPSVGSWNEWCPGGVQCFTWTIPTLAANATATLNLPLYVVNATGPIVGTATLLGSTPTDANAANNIASVTVNPATPPPALLKAQATQLIPVVIQTIAPNPSDGEVIVELESLDAREVQFDFSNSIGSTILSQKRAVEKGMNRVLFDVSALPQGVYLVSPNTNQGRKVPTKFVKL
jgi:subtilase family serine protease